MNLANKLTIFRILLVPIMVIIPLINIQEAFLGIPICYLIIDGIFIIASITDKLDGNIARKRNEITTFGKFLDPIADKILVIAAMIILVELDSIPAWIPIVIVTREFIVSGYRLIALEKGGEVIAANMWGKLKTVFQMTAIILAFININGTNSFFYFVNNELNSIELSINIITSILMVLAVIATVFSGWTYIKNGKQLLQDK